MPSWGTYEPARDAIAFGGYRPEWTDLDELAMQLSVVAAELAMADQVAPLPEFDATVTHIRHWV